MPTIEHIYLSPTTIQSYLSCPQMFMFNNFAERIEKEMNVDDPTAAQWGTLMHSLLADHYSGKEFVSSGNADLDKRFHEYKRQYSGDLFTPTMVETKLSRPLNERVTLVGTVDMVVGDTVWDHKTTKAISDKDLFKYDMTDQMTHYLWLSGLSEGTAIINQISSAKNPTIKFHRITTPREAHQVKDWLERVEYIANDIIIAVETNTAWLARRTSACGDFGGCFHISKCKYGNYEVPISSFTNDHFSIKFKEE
jgi:hypothetical protein